MTRTANISYNKCIELRSQSRPSIRTGHVSYQIYLDRLNLDNVGKQLWGNTLFIGFNEIFYIIILLTDLRVLNIL